MVEIDSSSVVEGPFLDWDPRSEFVRNALGPTALCRRQADGAVRVVLASLHCNLNGVAHGGCISTLIDVAMAFRMAELFGSGVATVNLNLSFVSGAVVGEELTIQPRVDRMARRLGFCNCSVTVGERLVATGQATFVPMSR